MNSHANKLGSECESMITIKEQDSTFEIPSHNPE